MTNPVKVFSFTYDRPNIEWWHKNKDWKINGVKFSLVRDIQPPTENIIDLCKKAYLNGLDLNKND